MKNDSFIRFAIALLMALIIVYLASGSCSKDTKDKQNMAECYKFADEHWSKDEYRQWLLDSVYYNNPNVNHGNVSDTFPYWDNVEMRWVYFSHHLPEQKNEQYYEMIGKYEQFRWGWDDYSDDTKTSEHRQSYLECRRRAGESSRRLPTGPQ